MLSQYDIVPTSSQYRIGLRMLNVIGWTGLGWHLNGRQFPRQVSVFHLATTCVKDSHVLITAAVFTTGRDFVHNLLRGLTHHINILEVNVSNMPKNGRILHSVAVVQCYLFIHLYKYFLHL